MSGRRGLVIAVALIAVGGGLAVVCAGRVWAQSAPVAVTGTPMHVAVTGTAVAGALSPLGLALLALAVAVLATRGWVRPLVGALVAAVGLAMVAVSVHGHTQLADALARRSFAVQAAHVHADVSAWWALAVAGGLAAVVGGVLTALFARSWPAMGARYEVPEPRGDAASTWDALDRGEDPTA